MLDAWHLHCAACCPPSTCRPHLLRLRRFCVPLARAQPQWIKKRGSRVRAHAVVYDSAAHDNIQSEHSKDDCGRLFTQSSWMFMSTTSKGFASKGTRIRMHPKWLDLSRCDSSANAHHICWKFLKLSNITSSKHGILVPSSMRFIIRQISLIYNKIHSSSSLSSEGPFELGDKVY